MRRFWFLITMAALAAPSAYGQDTADAGMNRRLALSQQYENLVHREKRLDEVYARQLKLVWDACADDPCRAALNQAIAKAIGETSPGQERAIVRLMASRLTEEQLRAAIAFAQSPQGVAIIAAEADMSTDLAKIAHDFASGTTASVRRSFCSAQPEACARVYARLAPKPAGHQ
ncbi:DUF2059 domain-containing protein [Sphingomonas sp. RT2P30]